MKPWPPEGYRWYREACEMFDYPARAFGEPLKALISSADTVLDIGCGIGVASRMIAPWCKRIIALDSDGNALRQLEAEALRCGITNIETANDSWPEGKLIQTDIIIALHVCRAMRKFDNLKLVFERAKRGGFIASNASCSLSEEPFGELNAALGIAHNPCPCANGCYIKGVLDTLGAHVTCAKVVYDFGQPLDTLDEALRFIRWQIGADESAAQTVEKYVDRYIVRFGNRYLVPITRQSCGITFLK